MNVKIDNDLAERIKRIANNNGVTANSYVNSLVEGALKNDEIAKQLIRTDKSQLTTAEVLALTRSPEEMRMDAQDTLLEMERIKGIDYESEEQSGYSGTD